MERPYKVLILTMWFINLKNAVNILMEGLAINHKSQKTDI